MALLRGKTLNSNLLKIKTYSQNVIYMILFNLVEKFENKIIELGK